MMKLSTQNLRYEYMFNSHGGQDGAIFGGYLFRFQADGRCWVHTMDPHKQIAEFRLDKADIIKPHCNSVCFGSKYYDDADEFPLMYANVYNSYDGQADNMAGTCCVYRIMKEENEFSSKLVQVIKIGFVDNFDLWRSGEDVKDIRPFGNFIVDTDKDKYYAFVMRDKFQTTRFFEFDLPDFSEGIYNETYDANMLILKEDDIKSYFDCEYSRYLQGACYGQGKIFSVSGGTVPIKDSAEYYAQPKLMIVDLENKKQYASFFLYDIGLEYEPEFIYYYKNRLYYSDCLGRVFSMIFD